MRQKYFLKSNKQGRLLLILPLVVAPILIASFAFLNEKHKTQAPLKVAGLQTTLPSPRFRQKKDNDKLSIYNQADRDSEKLKDAMKKDPFSRIAFDTSTSTINSIPKRVELNDTGKDLPHSNSSAEFGFHKIDSNERKVMEKIRNLKQILANGQKPTAPISDLSKSLDSKKMEARLDQVAGIIHSNGNSDPEMSRLNAMLDKIISIQHPENLQAVRKEFIPEVTVGKVSKDQGDQDKVYFFSAEGNSPSDNSRSFNHSALHKQKRKDEQSLLTAVVISRQTIVSGDPITVLLLDDLLVDSMAIPKNTLVTGTTSISGNRVFVTVPSIVYSGICHWVQLEACDENGMPGISFPASLVRDAGKESVNQITSAIGISSLDPSIGTQAASAGLQALKTMIGKKVRQIKVQIPGSFKIFLKTGKQ